LRITLGIWTSKTSRFDRKAEGDEMSRKTKTTEGDVPTAVTASPATSVHSKTRAISQAEGQAEPAVETRFAERSRNFDLGVRARAAANPRSAFPPR